MNEKFQIIPKNKLKLVLTFIMLGIFVLAPTLKVLADSSEPQSGNQSESQNTNTNNHSEDRQVQQNVNTGDGSAQYQSELQSGNQKNSFQFELQTHEKVEFSFSYKSEASSTHNEVEMKFELRRLVEFVDNTTNPNNIINGLDKMDTVVQQIDFESLMWQMSSTSTTSGNQTFYTINVNATQGSMIIKLTFFVTTGFVNKGNYTLVPNAVKFNVEIINFPFKQQNSLLAAQVQIKNSIHNRQIENNTEDQKDGYAGKQQQISFANNSAGAYFSWAQTYLANGVNRSIVVSPVSNDNEGEGTQAKMYFNFVQANDIFWDPSVGVTRASMTVSKSSPGFELLAILAIPVIVLISKRRYMNRKK